MRLTNRKKAPLLSLTDILHVVLTSDHTQSPQGSSYYTDLQQLVNFITASTQSGSGTASKFTKDIPVVLNTGDSLGRYHNGDTIPASGKTAEEVINDIASAYINPTFSVFTRTAFSPTILDLGDVMVGGTQNFTWDTTTQNNIASNVVSVYSNIVGNVLIGNNLAKSGTASLTTTDTITMTTPVENKVIYTISAPNTHSVTFSRTLTASWRHRWFYGKSPLTDLTTQAQVTGLASSNLVTTVVNNYVTFPTSVGNYIYWVIPSLLAQPSDFRDSTSGCLGNNIPFIPLGTISITRFGVTTSYTKYRSQNTIDGAQNSWLCS